MESFLSEGKLFLQLFWQLFAVIDDKSRPFTDFIMLTISGTKE
jgi:hypothetical protein